MLFIRIISIFITGWTQIQLKLIATVILLVWHQNSWWFHASILNEKEFHMVLVMIIDGVYRKFWNPVQRDSANMVGRVVIDANVLSFHIQTDMEQCVVYQPVHVLHRPVWKVCGIHITAEIIFFLTRRTWWKKIYTNTFMCWCTRNSNKQKK